MTKIILIVNFLTSGIIFAQSSSIIKGLTSNIKVSPSKFISSSDSITPITYHNNEVTSFMLEDKDGKQTILGVLKDGKFLGGIINAYIGYRSLIGGELGIEVARTVQFGVMKSRNTLFGEGRLINAHFKNDGYFVNLKFEPFEEVQGLSILAGYRKFNDYRKVKNLSLRDYIVNTGNASEYVIGLSLQAQESRLELGVEAGYLRARNLNVYEYTGYAAGYPPYTDSTSYKLLDEIGSVNRPTLNLTMKLKLFK